jgi:hypothetical protein
VTSAAFRLVLAFVAVAFVERSCGFTPADRKDEGEPCTRSTECRVDLECRAGVCSVFSSDGGPLDASWRPIDADVPDASRSDADVSDATVTDADVSDADVSDASALDAASDDAGS